MDKNSDVLVLGIDLGGTKILTAVTNPWGEMLAIDHSITPAAEGQRAVLGAIVESVNRVLDQAGIVPTEIAAIGVGAPGPSNPDSGVLFASPNLPGWRDVPLRDLIEEEIGRRTFLINDANAAALGEFCFGAAQGVGNFIYITISTGIGGGIFIEGELYTGAIGTAAEIGHMTIDDKGPLCNCGNSGCWEVMASGTALAREARARIKEGAKTSIMALAGGDMDRVNAQFVHRAAEQGDPLAGELISRTGYYLGVGMANLINLFNPERIVIGGGLSSMGDVLLGEAKRVAGKRAYRVAFEAAEFVLAELGQNSGVLGAAAFALQEMEK